MRLKTFSVFVLGVFSAIAAFTFTAALAQQPEKDLPAIHARYSLPLTIQVPRSALSESGLLTFTFAVEVNQQIVLSQTNSLTGSFQVTVTGAPEGIGIVVGEVYSLGIAGSSSSLSADETPKVSARAGTVRQNANLRSGPSTSYAVIGQVFAGDAVGVVGANADGRWLLLDGDRWIAATLVELSSGEAKFPGPAPTPYPLTEVEKRYASEVKRLFTSYLPMLRDMQNALRLAEQDPSVLGRKVWITEISGYAIILSAFSEEMNRLVPSARLEEARAKFLESAAFFDAATDIILIERTDAMTVDMYNGVRANIKAGFDKLAEGVKEIQELEEMTAGSR